MLFCLAMWVYDYVDVVWLVFFHEFSWIFQIRFPHLYSSRIFKIRKQPEMTSLPSFLDVS